MTTEEVETAEKPKNGGRIIAPSGNCDTKPEDPAEEVQRSRYLSTLPISTCAAKNRKRRKKGHNEAETASSLEEDGLEPVLLEKLFSSQESGMNKRHFFNLDTDSEEKTEHRNDQLRKRNKSVQSKQATPVKSSKQVSSSTEDEGFNEWKPTQDSEVSEEPVRTRVRKEESRKKESVIILQRPKGIESSSESDHLEEREKKPRQRMTNVAKIKERLKRLASSTEDVSGVGKSTPEYPESDSGGEEEQVREMDRKEAENSPVPQKEISTHNWLYFSMKGRIAVKVPVDMQQAFVSPGTVKVLKSRNIKRQQVGSASAQMCTSELVIVFLNCLLKIEAGEFGDGWGEGGQGREAETSVELFEKEGSDGEKHQ
ncbi:hypothetical protein Q7C36_005181 [Tachysurus vachellii]|uniref:Uncharacterized protein n=1 Tax=Tachysurus vachellii TaxID=175792 RepID=A0AA88T2C5_TACVA|nr:hypothetical protein Q7C36_005181 [Tachysurus vachellii]